MGWIATNAMARSRVRLSAILADSYIHAFSSPVAGLTTTKTRLSLLSPLHVFIFRLRRGRLDLQLSRRRLGLRRLVLVLLWFLAAAPSTFAAGVSFAILLLSVLLVLWVVFSFSR